MVVSAGVGWDRVRSALAGLALALAGLPVGAYAQDATAPAPTPQGNFSGLSSGMLASGTIHAVRVTGTQRIEPETVASYLVVQSGDPFDPETLDLSLKRLYGTGLFADVGFDRQGDDLIVKVVENPIINRIVFEGNHSKDDKKLGEEVQVRPRTVFTRARVQADVTRIVELYRRSGRFAAKVTPKIIELPQNRVDLVFEISEGPVSDIAKINFIGNRAFTDRELKSEIVTRESRLWTLFSSNDNYDPDRVAFDGEQLRKFYLKNGYADFSVVSSVAEMTPDGKDFILTYTIDEGDQYKFGKVTVETALQEIDPKVLENVVGIREGETYSSDRLDAAKDTITFLAGTVGYAFVDVKPRASKRAGEKDVLDVVLQVNEGPRVYVERINIRGNTRTLDKVLRREIRVAEGDPYNRVLIDRSKTRLRALDFFKEVDIKEEPGTAPDRTILDVSVEEQPTGELSVGFGFSSEEFTGDIEVTERNLLGRGQYLRLQLSASNVRQQLSLSFREPYFLDRNLQAGFDLYKILADYEKYSGFKTDSIGASIRTGFPLTEYSSLGIHYQIDSTDVEADTSACNAGLISSSICLQVGSNLSSQIGYDYAIDLRDDPIEPSKGTTFSFSQDFAGVGGDSRYLRSEVATAAYFPIYRKDVVLSLRWAAGYLWTYTDEGVRLDQRFFKGGATFRGFETAGVGPRDVTPFTSGLGRLDDALGGKAYGIGTVELRVPTGLPKDYGIKAALFSDVGTLGLLDQSDLGALTGTHVIRDDLSLRASAGVSVSWKSPFGPVQIDIAQAFLHEDYDKTQTFRFSAGTRF